MDDFNEAAWNDYCDGEAGLKDEEGRLPDAFDPEAQADLDRHNWEFPEGYHG
jgi:hypothetical protein